MLLGMDTVTTLSEIGVLIKTSQLRPTGMNHWSKLCTIIDKTNLDQHRITLTKNITDGSLWLETFMLTFVEVIANLDGC